MFRSGDADLKGEMAKPGMGVHASPGGTSELGCRGTLYCSHFTHTLRHLGQQRLSQGQLLLRVGLVTTCEGREQNSYFLSVRQLLTVDRIAQENNTFQLHLYNPVKKLPSEHLL